MHYKNVESRMSQLTPYPVVKHDFPTKLYVRTLTLRPDAKLIDEYRLRHAAGNVWPEIVAGIKSVGILEMDIFISGNLLVMTVEVPGLLIGIRLWSVLPHFLVSKNGRNIWRCFKILIPVPQLQQNGCLWNGCFISETRTTMV